jgi:ligand-binding sensor domain-containing protein
MQYNCEQMIFALLIILLFVLPFSEAAESGSLRFQHFNADDGLSNSTVNCILQDQKGFFWFGTFNGLNRYDGYQYTAYLKSKTNQNSIGSNRIIALCQDQQGIIWIGSNDNGISTYDPVNDRFTNYVVNPADENSLSNNTITSVFCDKKGRIWIGTAGGGLNLFLPASHEFRHYSMNSADVQLPSNHITYIAEDNSGNLWLTTEGVQFCCFNPEKNFCKTFELKLTGNATFSSYYKKIYIHDSILWIGTEGTGFFAFDLLLNKFIDLSGISAFSKLNNRVVKALQIDKNGRMWIATDGSGLTVINTNDNSYEDYHADYCNTDALTSDALLSLYIDRQQNVWLGTYQSGINLFRKNTSRFEILKQKTPDGLSNRSVLSIVEDEKEDLWVGTDGGGLNHINHKTGRVDYLINDPLNPQSISGNIVKVIYRDNNNNLWLGTFGKGLNKYERKTGRFIHYNHNANDPRSLSHENIWALCEDSKSSLWVGTLGDGLNLFDVSTEKSIRYVADFSNPNTIVHPLVTVIFKDSRKNLWIGTEGGLDLFKPEENKFYHYKHNDNDVTSLSNNLINCIYEDSHKTLWIGTDGGGLNRLQDDLKGFLIISVNDGLPNNSVQAIQEDNENCLWLSTRGGLSRYNLKTNHIVNFDRYDGLPGNEFNGNSSLRAKNGKLYFGSSQGLCSFFPNQIDRDTTFPPLVFTSLKVYNSSIETARKYNRQVIIKESISFAQKIHLSYKENVFGLEFSALEYSAPSKIKYRYRLEGFNENWTVTDHTRRIATYTNLEGGNYRFILCSTNAEGEWNPTPITIDIQIDPPYWKSLWFRILIFVLILGLILIFYSYNIERHRQKLREESLTNEKELARLRNDELRSEIASNTMLIAQKNEVLQHVITKLADLGQTNNKSELNESISLLQKEIDRDSYWEQFHYNFDRVYMNLLTRLKEKFPEMTRTNLKLCAYLRLNLSSKEIASLLNITVSGIDKARNRLRKKLNLEPNEDLYEFLLKF